MNSEFILALEEIEREKNIKKEVLLETIENALISAYKKNYETNQDNVFVSIDNETGVVRVFAKKTVVEEVTDPQTEISLEEAHKISKQYDIGSEVEIEATPKTFGRIAAQTAKQMVTQKIREVERENIYEEFSAKEHTVIEGIIQRIERRNIYLDAGKAEVFL